MMHTMTNHEILLMGIVGSTAYGLNHAGSDVDRLGIFAAPTSAFHGLHTPQETHKQEAPEPDITIHEAAKWCRLAMGSNPTVTELVWLPDHLIEVMTDWGAELRSIRSCFPTATGVRNAYLGYATQQFKRLSERGNGTFSSDTAKRTAKHARHLYRLCYQGHLFYASGRLEIELPHFMVERIRSFGDRVAGGDITTAAEMLAHYEREFDAARSPLGDRPDEERVERWLHAVRHAYWKESEDVFELQRRDAIIHAELLAGRTATGRRIDQSRYFPYGWQEGRSPA